MRRNLKKPKAERADILLTRQKCLGRDYRPDTTAPLTDTSSCTHAIEPPSTDRYARLSNESHSQAFGYHFELVFCKRRSKKQEENHLV